MDETTGCIFDIQRFSLFDGPGVRTVVFLKGCPLHCTWCHNPEGLLPAPQILFRPDQCISCGSCRVCPNGAHSIEGKRHIFRRSCCTGCGLCAEACPSRALQLVGRYLSVEDVMKTVRADARYYASDGGLTLSGGEPVMQTEFARSLLEAARSEGYHTALETSGHVDFSRLEFLLPAVSLFLFDWKHSDEAMLKRYTGAALNVIRANLLALDERGADIILRCPVIPGINDSDAHLEGIVAITERLRHCSAVHLLPYHAIGQSKAAQLDMKEPFLPPSRESSRVDDMCRTLTERLRIPVMVL